MTRKRKQSTDTKLHFGTVKGRYKPWERDPKNNKKERNTGKDKGNETNKDKKKREETETESPGNGKYS